MHLIRAGLVAVVLLATPALADVTWGGWLEVSLLADTRPNSLPGFDVHPFYLYIQAEPFEGLRVFGELEFEHLFQVEAGEPGFGELKIERLYVEKEFSTEHNFRAGKFVNPFGFWYRLHWNFLTETSSTPFSMDNSFVPQHQVGLQYWGRAFLGDNEFSYFVWLGNGPDIFGARSVWQPGVGASAFWNHAFDGRSDLSVGATAGVHLQWSPDGNGGVSRELNGVVGVELKLVRVDLRAEFYAHSAQLQGLRLTTYETVVGWVLPQVLAATYRFDWGADGKSADVPGIGQAHSLGALWKPHPALLTRFEARWHGFVDTTIASYWTFSLSMAAKF